MTAMRQVPSKAMCGKHAKTHHMVAHETRSAKGEPDRIRLQRPTSDGHRRRSTKKNAFPNAAINS